MKYEQAFMQWRNAFKAQWPNLLTEPESEKVKTSEVKLKSIIAFLEVLMPACPQEVKAELIQWAADNANEDKMMFKVPLVVDTQAIADYEPPTADMGEDGIKEPKPPKPFHDEQAVNARKRQAAAIDRSVADLMAKLPAMAAGSASTKKMLNGHARR
jgi:hypothetical protein